MPTYEYVCKHCKHAFERFQSIKAMSIRICPVCGKNGLKRLIGAGSGLIFKGSGFYSTDYRSPSYKKAEQAAKADTSAEDKKGKAGVNETAATTASKTKSAGRDKKESA